MNPFVFVLLLVACTDDFNSCYSHNTMAKIYPAAQTCEQDLEPSVKQFALYGEQIFAQCTYVHTNLYKEHINITWSVTNRGNFLIKNQNINNLRKNHETDSFTSSYPFVRRMRLDPLHKND
ncbi:hypothetical protein [Bartonella sp. B30(2025)]